jgi:uncharacterized lipoprotein YmbA
MSELDQTMHDIRIELTQVTHDLVHANAEFQPMLQQRRTQLVTRLRQHEMRRWFAPTPAPQNTHFAINIDIQTVETIPVAQ